MLNEKEELSPFCMIFVSEQHARLAVPETGVHAEQGEEPLSSSTVSPQKKRRKLKTESH
jgi:hypothetical protein